PPKGCASAETRRVRLVLSLSCVSIPRRGVPPQRLVKSWMLQGSSVCFNPPKGCASAETHRTNKRGEHLFLRFNPPKGCASAETLMNTFTNTTVQSVSIPRRGVPPQRQRNKHCP